MDTPTPPAPTLLLADAAQIQAGKISILGGCWSVLDEPAPHVLIALVHMAGEDLGVDRELVLRLLDAEGNPVLGQDPDGGVGPVRISVRLSPEVAEASELPVTLPVVIGLSGLPLGPGTTYAWVAELELRTRLESSLAFRTGDSYPDLAVQP